jgi:hypothetical protein
MCIMEMGNLTVTAFEIMIPYVYGSFKINYSCHMSVFPVVVE